jgi:hypothetical protein
MRVRLVSKDNGPKLRPLDGKEDRETVEENRLIQARADQNLIRTYTLKLNTAAEVENKKGQPHGPISRLYSQYLAWQTQCEDANYLPTLDRVLNWCEHMDNNINHRTGVTITGTNAGRPTGANGDGTSAPSTTSGSKNVDQMDWESTARMESFKAMATKVLKNWSSDKKGDKKAGPRCYACGSSAHKVRECEKKEEWMKRTLSAGGGGSGGGGGQKKGGKGKKVENRITEVDSSSEAEN